MKRSAQRTPELRQLSVVPVFDQLLYPHTAQVNPVVVIECHKRAIISPMMQRAQGYAIRRFVSAAGFRHRQDMSAIQEIQLYIANCAPVGVGSEHAVPEIQGAQGFSGLDKDLAPGLLWIGFHVGPVRARWIGSYPGERRQSVGLVAHPMQRIQVTYVTSDEVGAKGDHEFSARLPMRAESIAIRPQKSGFADLK